MTHPHPDDPAASARPPGTLVVLNGTTSVGKTSTQRAVLRLAGEPWLAAGVDHFWPFLFGPYNGFAPPADEGFHWIVEGEGDDLRILDVRTGPVGRRFFSAMFRAMRAFLDAGFHVVSDQCLWDPSLVDECAEVFRGVDAWMVGLRPPPEVSDAWERQRTDKRAIGMTRAVGRLMASAPVEHDLVLDPSAMTPDDAATAILTLVRSGARPAAFEAMRAAVGRGG